MLYFLSSRPRDRAGDQSRSDACLARTATTGSDLA
jgi:hypothetical protein